MSSNRGLPVATHTPGSGSPFSIIVRMRFMVSHLLSSVPRSYNAISMGLSHRYVPESIVFIPAGSSGPAAKAHRQHCPGGPNCTHSRGRSPCLSGGRAAVHDRYANIRMSVRLMCIESRSRRRGLCGCGSAIAQFAGCSWPEAMCPRSL